MTAPSTFSPAAFAAGLHPSPAPSFTTGRTPLPSRGHGQAPSTEADLVGGFRRSLSVMQLDAERMQLEAAAAFDAIENAFTGDVLPAEKTSILLASLDALRARLVSTGLGALPALDPAMPPAPNDVDMPALLERRTKESQTAFAASQAIRDHGVLVNDVLQRR